MFVVDKAFFRGLSRPISFRNSFMLRRNLGPLCCSAVVCWEYGRGADAKHSTPKRRSLKAGAKLLRPFVVRPRLPGLLKKDTRRPVDCI